MIVQQKQIDEIFDILAVRILVSSVKDCYAALGLVHNRWKPIPGRFKDYIAMPKPNMYQSIHTTVLGDNGEPFEIQIRTYEMHRIAEYGIAAHWKYKHASITQEEDGLDKWLRKVREALSGNTENAHEFLDNFKLSLYKTDVVVFTPKGEPQTLPYGATVLDFAYEIHTKIGNHAIGAKINHRIAPVSARLNSGDQIEVITAENAHPKAEWLDMVVTSKARQSIQDFLKGERQNNIEYGMQLLSDRLAEHNVMLSGRVLRKLMPAYNCLNKDELYSKVGAGIIQLDNLEKLLKENTSRKILKFWKLLIPGVSSDDNDDVDLDDEATSLEEQAIEDLADHHSSESEFEIAECCEPIPGDNVVGIRDPKTGRIVVHKSTCDTLIRLASQHGENIIRDEIRWSQHKAVSYLVTLELYGIDRPGILLDLTKLVTTYFSINMRAISIQSHDGIFEGTLSLYVTDIDTLNRLLEDMRKIKGVEQVRRMQNT
jgi:GTP pyrophosphokinase